MTGIQVDASYTAGGVRINTNHWNKNKGRVNQCSISVFRDAFLSLVQYYQPPIAWFWKKGTLLRLIASCWQYTWRQMDLCKQNQSLIRKSYFLLTILYFSQSMKDLGQKFRENTQNVEFANIELSVMKMQKMLGK